MSTLTLFGLCQMYIYDSLALYVNDVDALAQDASTMFPFFAPHDIYSQMYLAYAATGVSICHN